jgi:hypothetical protein
MLQEPAIGITQPLFQPDPRAPAQRSQPRHIHQLPRPAIRLAGVEAEPRRSGPAATARLADVDGRIAGVRLLRGSSAGPCGGRKGVYGLRAMRQQAQPLEVRHSHSLGDLPQALGVGGAHGLECGADAVVL